MSVSTLPPQICFRRYSAQAVVKGAAAVRIQAAWRGWWQLRDYALMKFAAMIIQNWWRPLYQDLLEYRSAFSALTTMKFVHATLLCHTLLRVAACAVKLFHKLLKAWAENVLGTQANPSH